MKKLLTFIVIIGFGTSSYGQGQINWANTSSTLITDVRVGGLMPVRTAPETTYYFGLFIAPFGTPPPIWGLFNDPNWQNVVSYTTNSTAAAGAGRMQNPGIATVPGFAPGTTVNFIVRGWQTFDSNGANWDPLNGIPTSTMVNYGQSQLGYVILGGGVLPLPSAFGVANGQIPGFVFDVPEPSGTALVILGALVFRTFRRRAAS